MQAHTAHDKIYYAMECLLIGAEGSGKSLLLKRLKWLSQQRLYKVKKTAKQASLPAAPATIPTVGTNIEALEVDTKRKVTVRELGGAMAPIWAESYEDCRCVIFVIDRSNIMHLSASTILLLEALSADALKNKPFLLVLGKSDLQNIVSLRETSNIVRVEDMKQSCCQSIDMCEASGYNGEGVHYILQWISSH